jgi:transposase
VPSMPQPSPPDRPEAGEEVILGIDTHKDVHAAVVISLLGVVLGRRCFPTTASGYETLLDWARGFGALRRAGVECTGSYGKALTRYLRAATGGIAVIEVNKPDRAARRRRGKTDTVDAEAAARAVLSGQASATAKTSDGNVEMLRLFKLAKSSAIKSRTQTINQLKSVLIGADPGLRDEFAALSTNALVRRCASLTVPATTDLDSATRYTLRLLAQRVQALSAEITELDGKLAHTVHRHAPQLLQPVGIGPDCAAELLIAAGDNPDRMAHEASFAALCGTSPVEASSGKTSRRRLNRGGNRHANSALYMIVVTRLRWCPRTRAYVQRRTAEGRSKREIIRCLKRYVAREVYQIMIGPQTSPRSLHDAA